MQRWLLVRADDNVIIDRAFADTESEATDLFMLAPNRKRMTGVVMSEEDYLNELELNKLENQTESY